LQEGVEAKEKIRKTGSTPLSHLLRCSEGSRKLPHIEMINAHD